MTKPKTSQLNSDKRRGLALQIQEYVDRYCPEFGKVDVNISPDGGIGTVRESRSKNH
jgi:hypothetical protein